MGMLPPLPIGEVAGAPPEDAGVAEGVGSGVAMEVGVDVGVVAPLMGSAMFGSEGDEEGARLGSIDVPSPGMTEGVVDDSPSVVAASEHPLSTHAT